jgi:hypothetical protein
LELLEPMTLSFDWESGAAATAARFARNKQAELESDVGRSCKVG